MLDAILVVFKGKGMRMVGLRPIGQPDGLVDLYADRELEEEVALLEAKTLSPLVHPAEVLHLLGGETLIAPALCLLPYEPALPGSPLSRSAKPVVPIAWRTPKPPRGQPMAFRARVGRSPSGSIPPRTTQVGQGGAYSAGYVPLLPPDNPLPTASRA